MQTTPLPPKEEEGGSSDSCQVVLREGDRGGKMLPR